MQPKSRETLVVALTQALVAKTYGGDYRDLAAEIAMIAGAIEVACDRLAVTDDANFVDRLRYRVVDAVGREDFRSCERLLALALPRLKEIDDDLVVGLEGMPALTAPVTRESTVEVLRDLERLYGALVSIRSTF